MLYNIPLTKLGKTLPVEFGNIHTASLDSVIYNGLKQMLNDTLAGKAKNDVAFPQKLLDKVMRGEYVHSDLRPDKGEKPSSLAVKARNMSQEDFRDYYCAEVVLKKIQSLGKAVPTQDELRALVAKNSHATNAAADAIWLAAQHAKASLDLDLGDFLSEAEPEGEAEGDLEPDEFQG